MTDGEVLDGVCSVYSRCHNPTVGYPLDNCSGVTKEKECGITKQRAPSSSGTPCGVGTRAPCSNSQPVAHNELNEDYQSQESPDTPNPIHET